MLSLTTPRLLIRPFTLADLPAVHQMLDQDPARNDPGSYGALSLEQRQDWLRWTIQSYEQLAWLHQPPYYDLATELLATGELIGACGFAPCLAEFGQLPSLAAGRRNHRIEDKLMCRSIKQLRNPDQPPADAEIEAAALQFVRKVSGYRTPSAANQQAFDAAVADIASTTRRLLDSLVIRP
jgi:hypothetical protein